MRARFAKRAGSTSVAQEVNQRSPERVAAKKLGHGIHVRVLKWGGLTENQSPINPGEEGRLASRLGNCFTT